MSERDRQVTQAQATPHRGTYSPGYPPTGVLTVQVTVSDALHIFGMNEVVTSFPYDVYRGQVHVVTNPVKRTTQIRSRKIERERDYQIIHDVDGATLSSC